MPGGGGSHPWQPDERDVSIEQTILDSIKRHPQDVAARLVYEDFLEERGEHAKAEFLRIQRAMGTAGIDDAKLAVLGKRLAEVLPQTDALWRALVAPPPMLRFDDLGRAVFDWLAEPIHVAAAVMRVNALVQLATIAQLTRVADLLRAGRGDFPLAWTTMGFAEAEARIRTFPGVGVAQLFSLHRNGYVREVGLRALVRTADPGALRALVLRLDDVVPALQVMAHDAIEARLDVRHSVELACALPLVERLSSRLRAGRGATLRTIQTFLLEDERGRHALLAAAKAVDPEVRRGATILLLRRGGTRVPLQALLEAALDDDDPSVVRCATIEITSSRVSAAIRDALIDKLEAHGDPWVRRRAVLARARAGDADRHLTRALHDPRAIVRFTARSKMSDPRSREVYRALLERSGLRERDLLGALAGLAEVGLAEDATLAVPWLVDARPRVRAEVARCLGMLAPAAHREALVTMTHDPSGRVRREATRALASRAALSPSR